ncbi:MAG: histidine phosphatase family protein [Gordonia sp. (in: high G+C Gram-positive bacteria)]
MLVVAGRTGPNRSVRFGDENNPLDERGRRDAAALVAALPDLGPIGAGVRVGPELSVRQTAELLGETFAVDDGLASLDVGAWRGRRPEELEPAELGPWFTDPSSRPHGGESVAEFVARIRAHVDAMHPASMMVVAKPVAQALLCTGPAEFFATELRPASSHRRRLDMTSQNHDGASTPVVRNRFR